MDDTTIKWQILIDHLFLFQALLIFISVLFSLIYLAKHNHILKILAENFSQLHSTIKKIHSCSA